MEPTIYKPSIYKGAGIYKTGDNGGGFVVPIFGTVDLLGRTYKTVQLDDIIFTSENLDYIDGSIANTHTTSNNNQGFYKNDDESTWGWNGRKCGRLYNHPAQQYIKGLLSNGWRLMTVYDAAKLSDFTKTFTDIRVILCKNVDWETYPGTNELGFDGLPYGAYNVDTNTYSNRLSLALDNYGGNKYMYSTPSIFLDSMQIGSYSGRWFNPIRLCKDV